MNIVREKVKKILMITLSNIGDVVLTLPVLGVLKREFPGAEITVVAPASCRGLFEAEAAVSKILIYDKHAPLLEKVKFALGLRKAGFDLAVDLRNSAFPLILGARYNTPLFPRIIPPDIHRMDKHLMMLAALGIPTRGAPFSIPVLREDKLRVHSMLNALGILPEDNLALVAPGAKSHIKRWASQGFAQVCAKLTAEAGLKVLLVGDNNDRPVIEEIYRTGLKQVYDLGGRTSLRELAYLLSLCKVLVTNDSAPLHIGSACGVATVAIFGPTDCKKYGPVYRNSRVLRKKLRCSPCERAQCRFNLECLGQITAEEVFAAAMELLLK